MVKELKKELSKLSGVDFFNPKYRDIFKKYFPDDTTESEINDNEEDRLKEVLGEEEDTTKTLDTQETPVGNKEEDNSEDKDNSSDEEDKDEEKSDNSEEETSDNSEEEVEQDKTDSETKEETDVSTEVDNNESSEQSETTEEEDAQDNPSTETLPITEDKPETDNTSQELLETKVELQLVKANVREDRLEPAKKLFMQEIHSLEDLDKLKDLIKQYPEWLKQNKPEVKPFGMPIGDNGEGLTEEEKRLKAMGIDPKS